MDFYLLYGIQNIFKSDFLDAVMPVITYLGDFGLIWLMIGFIFLFIRRFRLYGIECLSAVILAAVIVNIVIKPFIARVRPFVLDSTIDLIVHAPTSASFPSGHSAASFAAAVVICGMPIKLIWKVLAIGVACLVAFSRLYLFVHFPSDVFGGILIGILCGFICLFLGNKFVAPRLNRKSETQN